MAVRPENVRDQVARRGLFRRRAGSTDSDGMHYLESLPRRVVTVYLPLAIIVFVLLFPFYWMGITTLKSNEELYNFRSDERRVGKELVLTFRSRVSPYL